MNNLTSQNWRVFFLAMIVTSISGIFVGQLYLNTNADKSLRKQLMKLCYPHLVIGSTTSEKSVAEWVEENGYGDNLFSLLASDSEDTKLRQCAARVVSKIGTEQSMRHLAEQARRIPADSRDIHDELLLSTILIAMSETLSGIDANLVFNIAINKNALVGHRINAALALVAHDVNTELLIDVYQSQKGMLGSDRISPADDAIIRSLAARHNFEVSSLPADERRKIFEHWVIERRAAQPVKSVPSNPR